MITRPPGGNSDWLRTNCSRYCSIKVQLQRKIKQTHSTQRNSTQQVRFPFKRFSRHHRGQEHSGPPASGSNSKQDLCIGTNLNQSQGGERVWGGCEELLAGYQALTWYKERPNNLAASDRWTDNLGVEE